MERERIKQDKRTTEPGQPSQGYLEEAVDQLAHDLRVEKGALPLHSVFVKTYNLESRYSQRTESDDTITILWHNEQPSAIILETRDEGNSVVSQLAYFGPQTHET